MNSSSKDVETGSDSTDHDLVVGSTRRTVGLILGPTLFISLIAMGAPSDLVTSVGDVDSAHSAWLVLCLVVLMAVWWVTEAIPIPVTALLPLVVLPLTGVQSAKQTSSEYFHPIIVLLLGGFIVAKAIERWNLHRRIALFVVSFIGFKPSRLVASFMLSAAVLSMWVSNSATCIMLTPIALSVAGAVVGSKNLCHPFTYALMLGTAYACSVGGLATPIGTPTNLIVMGYLSDTTGLEISFGQWMAIGLPVVFLILPVAWFVLTRFVFNLHGLASQSMGVKEVIQDQRRKLGSMTVPEKRTLMVFSVIAFAWSFKGFLKGLTLDDLLLFSSLKAYFVESFGQSVLEFAPLGLLRDEITAIFGVILCFLVPSGSSTEKGSMLLDWKTAESIPWGPLLLFGGGMSMAFAIRQSGMADWVGSELAVLSTLPTVALVLLLTLVVIFITEIMSNVATASTLMPILGAAALSSGIDIELLAIPIAMAASCAFMLPTATGPNAVVFASGQVTLPTMVRAGFVVNCVSIPIITGLSLWLAPKVFS